MRRLLLSLICCVSAFGQIYFPGSGSQYPGGYPNGQSGGNSLPFPGRRRNTNNPNNPNNNQVPTQTLTGMLRKISNSEMVIESDDKLVITIELGNNTKYFKLSGSSGRNTDLLAGDHVSADVNQDNNSIYHAVKVTQTKLGTADDRAAASQPPDVSPLSRTSPSPSGDDGDRPRLKRAPEAQIARGDSSVNDSPSTAPLASTAPAPSQPLAPPAPDPDDPGRPQLRRGVPKQTDASASPASSSGSARPSIHADEVNGVVRTPAPPVVTADNDAPTFSSARQQQQRIPRSSDPFIDESREEAFSFSETLPNYVVKQFTTRYQSEPGRGGSKPSWQAIDNVTADVIAENGSEKYKNVLVNGKAPKEAIEKTGSWSSGEFSSLLQDVFSTATNADFHAKRTSTIVNRAAFRYDFDVEQPNSHWHVYAGGQSYMPGYTGAVWIDKENHRVLRIELSAHNIPTAFPLDTVESAVDYDYVMIGDRKFLLPVHSEALSCERTGACSRNVIDFRNYKKFGAESSITFDPNN